MQAAFLKNRMIINFAFRELAVAVSRSMAGNLIGAEQSFWVGRFLVLHITTLCFVAIAPSQQKKQLFNRGLQICITFYKIIIQAIRKRWR